MNFQVAEELRAAKAHKTLMRDVRSSDKGKAREVMLTAVRSIIYCSSHYALRVEYVSMKGARGA